MAKALTAARTGLRRFFSISAFTPPPPATVPPPAEPSPNLFVSGLSKRTTSEGLRESFSKFGNLVDARVVTDRVSGYSKGFGFVRYATVEEAAEAIKGMDGKFLDGWVIFAEYAKPRPQPSQSQSSQPVQNATNWAPPSNYTSQASQSWSSYRSPRVSDPLPSYPSNTPRASEPLQIYSSYTTQESQPPSNCSGETSLPPSSFAPVKATNSLPSWDPSLPSQPPNHAPSYAYSSIHGTPEHASSHASAPPNISAHNSEIHSENQASETSYNFDSGHAARY